MILLTIVAIKTAFVNFNEIGVNDGHIHLYNGYYGNPSFGNQSLARESINRSDFYKYLNTSDEFFDYLTKVDMKKEYVADEDKNKTLIRFEDFKNKKLLFYNEKNRSEKQMCNDLLILTKNPDKCDSFEYKKLKNSLSFLLEYRCTDISENNHEKEIPNISNSVEYVPIINLIQHISKIIICHWHNIGIDIDKIDIIRVFSSCTFPERIFISHGKSFPMNNTSIKTESLYSYDFDLNRIIKVERNEKFLRLEDENTINDVYHQWFSNNKIINPCCKKNKGIADDENSVMPRKTPHDSYCANTIKNISKTKPRSTVLNFSEENGKMIVKLSEEIKEEYKSIAHKKSKNMFWDHLRNSLFHVFQL